MAGRPHVPDPAGVKRTPTATVAVGMRGLLVAEALGHLITSGGMHVLGCYATLAGLLERMRRCRPTLAVVDGDLREDPNAADAFLCRLRSAGPETRLVVITSEVDGPLARGVIAHDVRAVILASTPANDALAVLQQVLHDRTSFPAAVLARLDGRAKDQAMSPRQLEVLEQLALGRSNQEIARELFISVNTVKFHVQAIYHRLGVRNRVEAAAALAEHRARVFGPTQ